MPKKLMLGIWVSPRVKDTLQQLAYEKERKLSAYCAEILAQHIQQTEASNGTV